LAPYKLPRPPPVAICCQYSVTCLDKSTLPLEHVNLRTGEIHGSLLDSLCIQRKENEIKSVEMGTIPIDSLKEVKRGFARGLVRGSANWYVVDIC
jgi:hypothetical protein